VFEAIQHSFIFLCKYIRILVDVLVHIILHDDVSCYRPRCVCHLMGRVNKALKLLATVKRVVLFAFAVHMVYW
jgi:hypothetical protein